MQSWFTMEPASPETEPLQWWAECVAEGAKMPDAIRFMIPLARKYLAVPGANGSIERVWSSGRRVLVFNRQSLSSAHVHMLLTLKHNMEGLGMWPPAKVPGL